MIIVNDIVQIIVPFKEYIVRMSIMFIVLAFIQAICIRNSSHDMMDIIYNNYITQDMNIINKHPEWYVKSKPWIEKYFAIYNTYILKYCYYRFIYGFIQCVMTLVYILICVLWFYYGKRLYCIPKILFYFKICILGLDMLIFIFADMYFEEKKLNIGGKNNEE